MTESRIQWLAKGRRRVGCRMSGLALELRRGGGALAASQRLSRRAARASATEVLVGLFDFELAVKRLSSGAASTPRPARLPSGVSVLVSCVVCSSVYDLCVVDEHATLHIRVSRAVHDVYALIIFGWWGRRSPVGRPWGAGLLVASSHTMLTSMYSHSSPVCAAGFLQLSKYFVSCK